MTLGELIEELERRDQNRVVPNGLGKAMSYRGFYSELAFERKKNVTVGDMLKEARSALGKTFTGYKGGDFKMHEYTDVYVAPYGDTGPELSHEWLEVMLDPISCPECGHEFMKGDE